MFLHGVEDFNIVRDDTLRNPAFFEGDNLATFDCVIANPPFSPLEKWGERNGKGSYGRNIAGVPPDQLNFALGLKGLPGAQAPLQNVMESFRHIGQLMQDNYIVFGRHSSNFYFSN